MRYFWEKTWFFFLWIWIIREIQTYSVKFSSEDNRDVFFFFFWQQQSSLFYSMKWRSLWMTQNLFVGVSLLKVRSELVIPPMLSMLSCAPEWTISVPINSIWRCHTVLTFSGIKKIIFQVMMDWLSVLPAGAKCHIQIDHLAAGSFKLLCITYYNAVFLLFVFCQASETLKWSTLTAVSIVKFVIPENSVWMSCSLLGTRGKRGPTETFCNHSGPIGPHP